MRWIAVGAIAGAAAAMAVAAPAYAQFEEADASFTTTGHVTVTWHGDHARGCAAAGLCDYRGSLSLLPTSDGEFFLGIDGGRLSFVDGELDLFDASVARVLRRDPGARPEACVDSVPGGLIDVPVTVPPRSGRPARVGLEGGELSAGRCAGPDLSRVLSRLPRASVPVRWLLRGSTTIDLSGRARYASGRFSGTVVSTVRLHVGRVGRTTNLIDGGPQSPRPTPSGKLARLAELHAVYRVTGFAGKTATSFRAVGAPACTALDACGTSGSASWAILTGGGDMLFDASAVLRRSDRGLRGVLAAVRRRGFVTAEPRLGALTGTTSASLDRPGATGCSDTVFVPGPEFSLAEDPSIRVFLGSPEGSPSGPDILRAGCPGPSEASVFARKPVATGVAPVALLERRRFELPLRGGGSFDDGVYRGTWRSRFAFELRRVKLRVRVRLERVPR